jgi:hypothetical protein
MATKRSDGSAAAPNAVVEQPRGWQGEVSQLDAGFVDENTTLVMLTIGGNDAGWSDVLQGCLQYECLDPGFRVHNYPPPLRESIPARIHSVVKTDVARVAAEIRRPGDHRASP